MPKSCGSSGHGPGVQTSILDCCRLRRPSASFGTDYLPPKKFFPLTLQRPKGSVSCSTNQRPFHASLLSPAYLVCVEVSDFFNQCHKVA